MYVYLLNKEENFLFYGVSTNVLVVFKVSQISSAFDVMHDAVQTWYLTNEKCWEKVYIENVPVRLTKWKNIWINL